MCTFKHYDVTGDKGCSMSVEIDSPQRFDGFADDTLQFVLSQISCTSFIASSERGLIAHSKALGLLVRCHKTVNICCSVDPRWLQEKHIPNGRTVKLDFRHSRIPIFVQDRADVKHGQYASDDEVQRPESQVPPGTDPTGINESYSYSRQREV